MLRGTKTLHLRMQRHVENAQKVAAWLEAHPAVEKVVYPGLQSHPQAALAEKQMRGPGGMITFVVKPGKKPALERARQLLRELRLFACAESLGHESIEAEEETFTEERQHHEDSGTKADRAHGDRAVGQAADHHGVDDGHAHPAEFSEDQRKGEPERGAHFCAQSL